MPDDFPNRGERSNDEQSPAGGGPAVDSPEPGLTDTDGEAPTQGSAGGAAAPPEEQGEPSQPPAAPDAGVPADAGGGGGTF